MLVEICVNFIADEEVFHPPFESRENGVEQPIQPRARFLGIERLAHQIRRHGALVCVNDADMQDRRNILLDGFANLVFDVVELIFFAARFDFVPLWADVNQIDPGIPRLLEAGLDGMRAVALIGERIGVQTDTNRAARVPGRLAAGPAGGEGPNQSNQSKDGLAAPSHQCSIVGSRGLLQV